MTAQTIVAAPPCPDWCTAEHGPTGWDEVGVNAAKHCRSTMNAGCDRDGAPVQIEVSRFCDIEGATITVGGVYFEVVPAGAILTAEGCRKLASALQQVPALLDL